MCTECQRLQKKIALYREIVERAIDPLTPERFYGPIKDLEQRKATLHAGQRKMRASTASTTDGAHFDPQWPNLKTAVA
jgi:hypothetical protein